MRQIILDTETTGLSHETGDRLVEVGCVELVNRQLTGRTLHRYINPERKNNEEAVRVHGLTDAFLADKPKFAEIADELIDFIRDAEVIIHNAAFDTGFIDAEMRRLNKPGLRHHAASVLDTLLMAREMFPGKANSLDALCRRLEVDNSNRAVHGALLDAGLLAEVYIRLTRGQNSLVIEEEQETSAEQETVEMLVDVQIDLSQFELPVLLASPEEHQAHERILADLEKSSGGKLIWPRLMA
jgi:DNA polymerase-3 subunit epsilon